MFSGGGGADHKVKLIVELVELILILAWKKTLIVIWKKALLGFSILMHAECFSK